MAEAAMQGANCTSVQFGVQYLAQGHFDMQLSSAQPGGARIKTSDLPIIKLPTLPPELLPTL